jgi:tRNA(fMet)-specific endonuclease VapC
VKFLLDTNVLSDIGNQKPWHRHLVSKIALYGEHRCFLSSIGYAEMLSGLIEGRTRMSKQKLRELEFLYETLEVLAFDRDAARAAAAIRNSAKGGPLPKMDSLIAGHAKSAGMMLVTADAKDTGRMPGLAWVNWRPTA